MAYQPLTPQQYQKAVDSGFTADQIIANEKQRKAQSSPSTPSTDIPKIKNAGIPGAILNTVTSGVNAFKNFSIGAAAGINKAVIGIPQAMASGISAAGGAAGLPAVKQGFGEVADSIGKIRSSFDTPDTATLSGKTGDVAAQVATLATPGGLITKGQKALGILTEGTPWILQKLAQVAPEVVGTGVTQYAASGGDTKSAIETGAGAGVLSTLSHVGSDAFRSLIPQTVKDNVAGFLKFTGKTALKDIATNKKIDDAVGAFTTMVRQAPDIKVIGNNGVEHTFDPKKTDFFELPQVLYQTKNKIYDEYTKLAEQSGNKGAFFGHKDFTDIKGLLEKYSGAGYTPAYEAKAKQFMNAIDRYGTHDVKTGKVTFGDISPKQIQTLVESVNKDVNPSSDAAGAIVASDLSNALREKLDAKISSATGGEYQKLRDAYGQLKSVEKDVIERSKVALRQSGHLPSDFIDGLASVDILQGLLTGNIGIAARGGSIAAVKAAFKYLRDPEIKMKRAFQMLVDGPDKAPGPLGKRFTAPSPVKPKAKVAAPTP